jgi:hypothetical protein
MRFALKKQKAKICSKKAKEQRSKEAKEKTDKHPLLQ